MMYHILGHEIEIDEVIYISSLTFAESWTFSIGFHGSCIKVLPGSLPLHLFESERMKLVDLVKTSRNRVPSTPVDRTFCTPPGHDDGRIW